MKRSGSVQGSKTKVPRFTYFLKIGLERIESVACMTPTQCELMKRRWTIRHFGRSMFKHGDLPLVKAQHRNQRSKHISEAVNLCPGVGDPLAPFVPWTNKSFNSGTILDSVSGVSEYFCCILKICFSFSICLLRQRHLCLVIVRESSRAHIDTGGNFARDKELRVGVHVTQHSTELIYDEREEKIKGSEMQQYWIVNCFVSSSKPVKFNDKSFIYKSEDLDHKYFLSYTYLFMLLAIINFVFWRTGSPEDKSFVWCIFEFYFTHNLLWPRPLCRLMKPHKRC